MLVQYTDPSRRFVNNNNLHIQYFPAYLQILFFQIVLINYYYRRL